MTPTEERGLAWLMQHQGYAASDLRFQHRHSPDFDGTDGRGWEIKRIGRGNEVRFSAHQVCDLRLHGKTTVVIFSLTDEEPSTVPFEDLVLPGMWGDLRLTVYWQPKFCFPQQLHSRWALDRVVAAYRAQNWQRIALPSDVLPEGVPA